MRNEEDIHNDRIDSWVKWFKSRKSAPTIDQFHKGKVFQTFNANVDDDECKKHLSNKKN